MGKKFKKILAVIVLVIMVLAIIPNFKVFADDNIVELENQTQIVENQEVGIPVTPAGQGAQVVPEMPEVNLARGLLPVSILTIILMGAVSYAMFAHDKKK